MNFFNIMTTDKKEKYKNYIHLFTNANNDESAKETSVVKEVTTATTVTRHHNNNMRTHQDKTTGQHDTHDTHGFSVYYCR